MRRRVLEAEAREQGQHPAQGDGEVHVAGKRDGREQRLQSAQCFLGGMLGRPGWNRVEGDALRIEENTGRGIVAAALDDPAIGQQYRRGRDGDQRRQLPPADARQVDLGKGFRAVDRAPDLVAHRVLLKIASRGKALDHRCGAQRDSPQPLAMLAAAELDRDWANRDNQIAELEHFQIVMGQVRFGLADHQVDFAALDLHRAALRLAFSLLGKFEDIAGGAVIVFSHEDISFAAAAGGRQVG
jgi:hypothetical protein